jgi:hypothetical protein
MATATSPSSADNTISTPEEEREPWVPSRTIFIILMVKNRDNGKDTDILSIYETFKDANNAVISIACDELKVQPGKYKREVARDGRFSFTFENGTVENNGEEVLVCGRVSIQEWEIKATGSEPERVWPAEDTVPVE